MNATIDLYATLRIRKSANKATIKKAFRRRALETHPDRHGDRAEFEAVKLAYSVLMDDARRAKYNATGQIEDAQPDNRAAMVRTVLIGAFSVVMRELLKQGKSPIHEDIVSLMRQALSNGVDELRRQKERIDAGRKFLKDAAGRFVAENGDNFMDQAIDAQFREADMMEKNVGVQIEQNEAALKELKRFRFKFTARRAAEWATTGAATVMFRTTATTG